MQYSLAYKRVYLGENVDIGEVTRDRRWEVSIRRTFERRSAHSCHGRPIPIVCGSFHFPCPLSLEAALRYWTFLCSSYKVQSTKYMCT